MVDKTPRDDAIDAIMEDMRELQSQEVPEKLELVDLTPESAYLADLEVPEEEEEGTPEEEITEEELAEEARAE